MIAFFAINYLMVAVSTIFLWRSSHPAFYKIVWSLLLMMPLLGLVFYGWMASPPKPLPGHMRQGVHEYVAPTVKDGIDYDHGVK